ncbi:hypothetical protein [Halosimplex amylolyticum]|uniref:hypothetical protein n=1 Tax=Halosimplex amylolyticum TaxID=3396616 RepID=UPI003F548D67
MSETDPEPAESDTETPQEADADPSQDDGDDAPDISDEETADLSGLDLDGADLDPDPDDEPDADERDEPDADTSQSTETLSGGGGGRWGEMYVSVLTQTTNRVIEKHGDEDSEKVDREHFEEVDLDRHFNETMEKFKGSAEMEPEQALVIGSIVGVAGPICLETNLLSELKEEIQDDA